MGKEKKKKRYIYWLGTGSSLSGWVANPVQSASLRHGLNIMLHHNNVFIASGIFSAEIQIQRCAT